MTKRKISATIDPDRLAEAVELTGSANVSLVLGQALVALIDREKERQWLSALAPADLPGEVIPDLSDLPWEE